MLGLRIVSNNSRKVESQNLTDLPKVSLSEIFLPIKAQATDLFWLLQNVTFKSSIDSKVDEEIRFSDFYLHESGEIKITKQNFINDFHSSIVNDWCLIGGMKKTYFRIHSISSIDPKFISENFEVTFICIDGAYWEVYGVEGIISTLKLTFPNSLEINLSESSYF